MPPPHLLTRGGGGVGGPMALAGALSSVQLRRIGSCAESSFCSGAHREAVVPLTRQRRNGHGERSTLTTPRGEGQLESPTASASRREAAAHSGVVERNEEIEAICQRHAKRTAAFLASMRLGDATLRGRAATLLQKSTEELKGLMVDLPKASDASHNSSPLQHHLIDASERLRAVMIMSIKQHPQPDPVAAASETFQLFSSAQALSSSHTPDAWEAAVGLMALLGRHRPTSLGYVPDAVAKTMVNALEFCHRSGVTPVDTPTCEEVPDKGPLWLRALGFVQHLERIGVRPHTALSKWALTTAGHASSQVGWAVRELAKVNELSGAAVPTLVDDGAKSTPQAPVHSSRLLPFAQRRVHSAAGGGDVDVRDGWIGGLSEEGAKPDPVAARHHLTESIQAEFSLADSESSLDRERTLAAAIRRRRKENSLRATSTASTPTQGVVDVKSVPPGGEEQTSTLPAVENHHHLTDERPTMFNIWHELCAALDCTATTASLRGTVVAFLRDRERRFADRLPSTRYPSRLGSEGQELNREDDYVMLLLEEHCAQEVVHNAWGLQAGFVMQSRTLPEASQASAATASGASPTQHLSRAESEAVVLLRGALSGAVSILRLEALQLAAETQSVLDSHSVTPTASERHRLPASALDCIRTIAKMSRLLAQIVAFAVKEMASMQQRSGNAQAPDLVLQELAALRDTVVSLVASAMGGGGFAVSNGGPAPKSPNGPATTSLPGPSLALTIAVQHLVSQIVTTSILPPLQKAIHDGAFIAGKDHHAFLSPGVEDHVAIHRAREARCDDLADLLDSVCEEIFLWRADQHQRCSGVSATVREFCCGTTSHASATSLVLSLALAKHVPLRSFADDDTSGPPSRPIKDGMRRGLARIFAKSVAAHEDSGDVADAVTSGAGSPPYEHSAQAKAKQKRESALAANAALRIALMDFALRISIPVSHIDPSSWDRLLEQLPEGALPTVVRGGDGLVDGVDNSAERKLAPLMGLSGLDLLHSANLHPHTLRRTNATLRYLLGPLLGVVLEELTVSSLFQQSSAKTTAAQSPIEGGHVNYSSPGGVLTFSPLERLVLDVVFEGDIQVGSRRVLPTNAPPAPDASRRSLDLSNHISTTEIYHDLVSNNVRHHLLTSLTGPPIDDTGRTNGVPPPLFANSLVGAFGSLLVAFSIVADNLCVAVPPAVVASILRVHSSTCAFAESTPLLCLSPQSPQQHAVATRLAKAAVLRGLPPPPPPSHGTASECANTANETLASAMNAYIDSISKAPREGAGGDVVDPWILAWIRCCLCIPPATIFNKSATTATTTHRQHADTFETFRCGGAFMATLNRALLLALRQQSPSAPDTLSSLHDRRVIPLTPQPPTESRDDSLMPNPILRVESLLAFAVEVGNFVCKEIGGLVRNEHALEWALSEAFQFWDADLEHESRQKGGPPSNCVSLTLPGGTVVSGLSLAEVQTLYAAPPSVAGSRTTTSRDPVGLVQELLCSSLSCLALALDQQSLAVHFQSSFLVNSETTLQHSPRGRGDVSIEVTSERYTQLCGLVSQMSLVSSVFMKNIADAFSKPAYALTRHDERARSPGSFGSDRSGQDELARWVNRGERISAYQEAFNAIPQLASGALWRLLQSCVGGCQPSGLDQASMSQFIVVESRQRPCNLWEKSFALFTALTNGGAAQPSPAEKRPIRLELLVERLSATVNYAPLAYRDKCTLSMQLYAYSRSLGMQTHLHTLEETLGNFFEATCLRPNLKSGLFSTTIPSNGGINMEKETPIKFGGKSVNDGEDGDDIPDLDLVMHTSPSEAVANHIVQKNPGLFVPGGVAPMWCDALRQLTLVSLADAKATSSTFLAFIDANVAGMTNSAGVDDDGWEGEAGGDGFEVANISPRRSSSNVLQETKEAKLPKNRYLSRSALSTVTKLRHFSSDGGDMFDRIRPSLPATGAAFTQDNHRRQQSGGIEAPVSSISFAALKMCLLRAAGAIQLADVLQCSADSDPNQLCRFNELLRSMRRDHTGSTWVAALSVYSIRAATVGSQTHHSSILADIAFPKPSSQHAPKSTVSIPPTHVGAVGGAAEAPQYISRISGADDLRSRYLQASGKSVHQQLRRDCALLLASTRHALTANEVALLCKAISWPTHVPPPLPNRPFVPPQPEEADVASEQRAAATLLEIEDLETALRERRRQSKS